MNLLDRALRSTSSLQSPGPDKDASRRSAGEVLGEYRLLAEPSDELTYAVIRLLRALRRYPEALELMTRRRPDIPAKAREVDFYEMELHLRCGDRQTAARLLASLESAGQPLRSSWKRSLEKLLQDPPGSRSTPAKSEDYLDDSPEARQAAAAFAARLAEGLRRPGLDLPSRPFAPSDLTDRILAGELWLQAGDMVPVEPAYRIDWARTFGVRVKTSLLSLFSLEYVGRLLDRYEGGGGQRYLDAARGIVESFLDFADSSAENRAALLSLRRTPSNDHAMSTRTHVLLRLLRLSIECAGPLEARVARLLHSHTLFLFNDENHRKNNHGVMADLALAELGAALGPATPDGRRLIQRAVTRLHDALVRIFDEDGLTNENTVGYQEVILELFEQAVRSCAAWEVTGSFPAAARSAIARGRDALRYCVWPDGSIPPIGDSFVVPGAAESINAPRHFAHSHFAVAKSDDLYLSFICGRRGDSHKHVDDTSITLRYGGEDVLIDGGRHHYDGQDPYRNSLVSAFGHSGIFPVALDGLRPKAYFKLEPEAAITGWSTSPEGVSMDGVVRFPRLGLTIRRSVRVDWPALVVVTDRVEVDAAFPPASVRQSWLLGKNLTIREDRRHGTGRTVRAVAGSCDVTLTLACQTDAEHASFRGLAGARYRGWCSESRGPALPVTELACIQTGTAVEFRMEVALRPQLPLLTGSRELLNNSVR